MTTSLWAWPSSQHFTQQSLKWRVALLSASTTFTPRQDTEMCCTVPQNSNRSTELEPDSINRCTMPTTKPDDVRRNREPSTCSAIVDICSNISKLPPWVPKRLSGREVESSTTVFTAMLWVPCRFKRREKVFNSPFPPTLCERMVWYNGAQKATTKKDVLLPLLQEALKHDQIEHKSHTETSACASTKTQLCKALSDIQLEAKVVNAKGRADSNLCNDHRKDIYNYLRDLEMRQAIKAQYLAGQEIIGTMLAMLIDWLVQIHLKFKLLKETLFICCNTQSLSIGQCSDIKKNTRRKFLLKSF